MYSIVPSRMNTPIKDEPKWSQNIKTTQVIIIILVQSWLTSFFFFGWSFDRKFCNAPWRAFWQCLLHTEQSLLVGTLKRFIGFFSIGPARIDFLKMFLKVSGACFSISNAGHVGWLRERFQFSDPETIHFMNNRWDELRRPWKFAKQQALFKKLPRRDYLVYM